MWTVLTGGTLPQWGTFVSLLGLLILAMTAWIKGIPERLRVKNEGLALTAKIEEELRSEAAERFREFREEVHGLRNELAQVRAELHQSQAKSMRRGDKVNMLRFILEMVLSELHAKEPTNKVLEQAQRLLMMVEDEPPQPEGEKPPVEKKK